MTITKYGKIVLYRQRKRLAQTHVHLIIENAFFSGSMKDMSTGPWFYPANRIEDMRGNPIKPNEPGKISGNIIDVVQGTS